MTLYPTFNMIVNGVPCPAKGVSNVILLTDPGHPTSRIQAQLMTNSSGLHWMFTAYPRAILLVDSTRKALIEPSVSA